MKTVLIVCVLFLIIDNSSSQSLSLSSGIINVNKAVKFINSIPSVSWEASSNGFDATLNLSQFKSRLGLLPKKKNPLFSFSLFKLKRFFTAQGDDLPKNYDCRIAYPTCRTISSIKEQSNCGSCWAVSVAAAFSDRLCTHSGGLLNLHMSADRLLACNKESKGCDGGYLHSAWEYIEKEGLITGGDYGSSEGCQPYSIKPVPGAFLKTGAKTPSCYPTKCTISFKAKKITELSRDEYEIRREIIKNGPVTAGFIVPLSFMFYKKGIYSKFPIDPPLGGHAVRIIGWGEENGKKYWLAANSWGRKWGENGTFKILRGDNHCDIESYVIAGLPVL